MAIYFLASEELDRSVVTLRTNRIRRDIEKQKMSQQLSHY